MHSKVNGFTLIEAMVAMTVVAILLAIAVPAWSHALAAANAGAARAELAATLLDAVRHSANAGSEVIVCPVAISGQCSGQVTWDGGWMAYADSNGNRLRDAGEMQLRRTDALKEGVHLRSTVGRTRLIFQPNGGNVGSNVTFTLCDARGPAHATSLVLANDGNLRQEKPAAAAASACVYSS
ncbi:MAG TPA: GspH/FimT family pseudopilin [Lysobacter sp.]